MAKRDGSRAGDDPRFVHMSQRQYERRRKNGRTRCDEDEDDREARLEATGLMPPRLRMPLAETRIASRLALCSFALLALAAATTGTRAQTVAAPLPPERPFDLDLKPGAPAPVIVMPAPAPSPASATEPARPDADPDADEGAEWPKRTPGQEGAEPAFDPDEKPERPGISTDPGTAILCLPPRLREILHKIADKYGSVRVTSTLRPPWRARRGSYHRRCEAMDFRVPGVRPRLVLDYVRALSEVGGHKVYWNGLIHIDTGPRRPW